MAILNPKERQMAKAIERGDILAQQALLTHHNAETRLYAIRQFARISNDPVLIKYARRTMGCTSHTPCHARGCPRCTLDSRDRKKQIVHAESASLSKNPQVSMAQRASIFHDVPEAEVWFVTINLEAVHPDDVVEKVKDWRPYLRRRFDKLQETFGVVLALGRFEDDPFMSDDLSIDEFCKPKSLSLMPSGTVAVKLHLHILFHIPEASHDSIRAKFVKHFGPGWIVNIRNIRHAKVNGIDVQGICGAARYMAKEHVNLSGLKDASLDDIHSVLKSLLGRKRASTRFDYGIRGLSNPDSRGSGKWMKRVRREYALPANWDRDKVVAYMLDEDLSEVVHGYPSSFDAWIDMEEDSRTVDQYVQSMPIIELARTETLRNPGKTSGKRSFAWSKPAQQPNTNVESFYPQERSKLLDYRRVRHRRCVC